MYGSHLRYGEHSGDQIHNLPTIIRRHGEVVCEHWHLLDVIRVSCIHQRWSKFSVCSCGVLFWYLESGMCIAEPHFSSVYTYLRFHFVIDA